MEPVTLLLSIVLVLITTLLYFKYGAQRRRFVAMVDCLPGPRKYPLIGTGWFFATTPRSEMMNRIQKLVNGYAPIFRMWSGPIAEVHLLVPEYAEVVLSGMKHIEKGFIYRILHPWLGRGLLTSSGTKWHSRRKMITPTFHFQILESFCDIFIENSQILVNKLLEQVNIHGEEGFDMNPFINRCALDMICETAMGININAQEGFHSDYVNAVHDVSELTTKRMFSPWMFNDHVFRWSSLGRRYYKCLQVLHGFTNMVIRERREAFSNRTNSKSQSLEESLVSEYGEKKRMAFLDLLLEATCDGRNLDDGDVQEEVDTFMFEGHDTTTVAMSWALFLLGLHPDVQEKIAEELDSIFQGSDRLPTSRDCQEMKYLERVIKEALRLYPSVPFILRTLEGDLDVGGYTLPEGVMIVIHINHILRSPEYFPNPEEFNPDNFLPERVQGRHPYAYIPFSAGPRNCIGQKFAMMEEKIVLASILRRFKLRSLQRREDVKMLGELVLRPECGIKMVLTPR